MEDLKIVLRLVQVAVLLVILRVAPLLDMISPVVILSTSHVEIRMEVVIWEPSIVFQINY